jgi:hypothetical protein
MSPSYSDFNVLPDMSTLPITLLSAVTETPTCDSLTNSSIKVNVPIPHCVDKPSTSLPNRIACTDDLIRKSIGF